MKKIIMIAVVLIGMINLSAVAQLQVGQGINPWVNKLPALNNMSLVSMNATPTINLLAGSRMDAFDNHPTQATILASGLISNGFGVGLKLDREQAGLSTHVDVQLGFTYYVYLNKEKGDKLSFFLGGHFMQDKLSSDQAIVIDGNDPGLTGISEYQPNGNASGGFSFFRENKYHIGLSAYNLITVDNAFKNSVLTNPTERAYYLVGGYTFRLNSKFALEPSGAAVFVNEKAYAWEAGVDLKFNKMVWIGAGYRSAGALKFNFGVTAQSWSFGYMCVYGSWVDATAYTYKAVNNSIFIRKVFNEGRGNKR